VVRYCYHGEGVRRLPRILLNAATVLSFVLCVVTMAAWVRSYRARDVVWWSWANPRVQLGAGTYRGGLFAGVLNQVGIKDGLLPPGAGWDQWPAVSYTEASGVQGTLFNRFGFALDYSQNSAYATRYLACPYWFIALLTALLPSTRLIGRRARRLRMRTGLCQHCGYDCRATPDRCPECGATGG
jgi:hypothetical protein